MLGALWYLVGLVVGLVFGTIGFVWDVVWGLAAFALSWVDIYFSWWAGLLLLYWVEYIDPWETKQRKDEVITFFPTIARVVDGGSAVAVPVHGWLYHPKRDTRLRRAIIAGLKRTMPPAADAAEALLLESRLSAFIVDNRRGKRVSVQFVSSNEDSGIHTLKTLSSRNGHFYEDVVVPRNQVSLLSYQIPNSRFSNPRWVRYASVLEDEQETVFKGESLLLEDVGVSVISDIDDTIRISMVCDKRKLVLYSFLKKLRSVPGMPQLYQNWQAEFGARFHYVSGGPWQYFESINEFCELCDFPKGTVHLRHLRIKDSSLWAFIRSPHFAKKRLIEPILREFPKRKFIFVGDSGEKDPEVYAELAAMYPEQVKAIFIRRAPERKAKAVVTKTEVVEDGNKEKGKEVEDATGTEVDEEDDEQSEEARMIAASNCGDEEEEDSSPFVNRSRRASVSGTRHLLSSAGNNPAVTVSTKENSMTVTEDEVQKDMQGHETHKRTQIVVEVSEEDRECLADMSEERKAREWKRFAPLFTPLKGRTLCRVFTCPSEIAGFTLDDILNCRAYSGEDAVEWENVKIVVDLPTASSDVTSVPKEEAQATEAERIVDEAENAAYAEEAGEAKTNSSPTADIIDEAVECNEGQAAPADNADELITELRMDDQSNFSSDTLEDKPNDTGMNTPEEAVQEAEVIDETDASATEALPVEDNTPEIETEESEAPVVEAIPEEEQETEQEERIEEEQPASENPTAEEAAEEDDVSWEKVDPTSSSEEGSEPHGEEDEGEDENEGFEHVSS